MTDTTIHNQRADILEDEQDTNIKGSQSNVSKDENQFNSPTEEELSSLRRVPETIPWGVYSLAFVELCERFSYYGTTVVCE